MVKEGTGSGILTLYSYTPEHCLVNGGFPEFLRKKPCLDGFIPFTRAIYYTYAPWFSVQLVPAVALVAILGAGQLELAVGAELGAVFRGNGAKRHIVAPQDAGLGIYVAVGLVHDTSGSRRCQERRQQAAQHGSANFKN